MTNLTISVDEAADAPGADFVAIAIEASGASGPEGRTWTREELHER